MPPTTTTRLLGVDTASKAAPILGEGGAVTQMLEIAENVGSMDADGDGHVSAQEALDFAKRLKNEASPMIARCVGCVSFHQFMQLCASLICITL